MMKKLAFVGAVAAALGVHTLMAATYYKVGSDPAGSSSFSTNVSDTVGWAIAPDATETTPFSEAEMVQADFVVSGLTLRTAEAADASCTFAGKSLRLESGAQLLVKSPNNAVITVEDLIVAGGGFGNGLANNSYTLAGKVTIESGTSFTLAASENGATRTLLLDSAIYGDATTAIAISDAERTGTGIFHLRNLENFYGAIHDVATVDDGSAKIYIDARCMGFEPEGMSDEQMKEMTRAFNLPR